MQDQQNDQPKGNPEWGYWLNFSPLPAEVQHDFCGTPEIAGATCPNCEKPLLRLLSLNAKDQKLNIEPAHNSVVHLLYCWTCTIPYGEFCYKVAKDGSVEILKLPSKHPQIQEFGPAGPYDGYTGIFPERQVSLQAMSESEQRILERRFATGLEDRRNEPPRGRHQIGGYPVIDNPSKTSCPICSEDMPLLAALCDDATGNQPFEIEPENSFAGDGSVQMIFHFCRNCSVVTAYHSCD
jgi:hypothetical protein